MTKKLSSDCMTKLFFLSNQRKLPKSKPSPSTPRFTCFNYERKQTNPTRLLLEYSRKELLNIGGYSPGFVSPSTMADKSNRSVQARYDTSLADIKPSDLKPEVDLDKFESTGILTFTFRIFNYNITIEFHKLEDCYKSLFTTKGPYTYKDKYSRLNKAIDEADVKIDCTCNDFVRNLSSNADNKGFRAYSKHTITSNISPQSSANSKGSGCKHILKILQNKSWISKSYTDILKILDKRVDIYDNDYYKALNDIDNNINNTKFVKLRRKDSITDNKKSMKSRYTNNLDSHASLVERAFLYRKNYGIKTL